MPADPKPNPTAETNVATGLAKIAMVLRHEAWADAGERGLTPTQSQILALLASRPRADFGIKEVAAHLAIVMGTASDAVSTLERKGLIEKKSSASDGRAVVLRMTARGRRRAKQSTEWPDVMLGAIGDLSGDEQAAFMRGLTKIIRSLQEQGKIPVARMCVNCTHFRPHEHKGQDAPHHCALIDAALGDRNLRMDCDEMAPANKELMPHLWQLFVNGQSLDDRRPGFQTA